MNVCKVASRIRLPSTSRYNTKPFAIFYNITSFHASDDV